MTLHYQSEVRDLPKPAERPAVDDAELDMARRLVESMAEPFDPARFKNAYQEKLMDLIQSKIAGKAVVTERAAERPNNIIDLMDALSASLKEQEDGSEGTAKAPARKAGHGGRGDGRARGRRRKARSQAQPQARLVTPAPGERTAGNAAASGPARARRPVR